MMKRKMINGLVVLLAAVCGPTTYITAVGAGSFFWNAGDSPVLDHVEVEIYSPQSVMVDRASTDGYTIEINVRNISDVARTLDSIDFGFESGGIDIRSSEPPFKEQSSYFGLQSYLFEQALQPGESITIEFEASSNEVGIYPVEVSICIDSSTSCADFIGEVEVIEAGS
jgi:hypothetical protein